MLLLVFGIFVFHLKACKCAELSKWHAEDSQSMTEVARGENTCLMRMILVIAIIFVLSSTQRNWIKAVASSATSICIIFHSLNVQFNTARMKLENNSLSR